MQKYERDTPTFTSVHVGFELQISCMQVMPDGLVRRVLTAMHVRNSQFKS